jgi:hypothetical protein
MGYLARCLPVTDQPPFVGGVASIPASCRCGGIGDLASLAGSHLLGCEPKERLTDLALSRL